jgi:glutamate dehydrogenase/leucine dehydrogenase
LIFADPKMPPRDKERLIRAFAAAIGDLVDYIPGPDLGTDEAAMGWIKDETGRAVGLPREIGGTRSMRSAPPALASPWRSTWRGSISGCRWRVPEW